MKKLIFLLIISSWHSAFAQKDTSGTAAKAKKDSIRMAQLEAKLVYPLIKGGKWSGIIPVSEVTEKPDPSIKYKLLFELTYNNPDSLAKNINDGLVEIGRIINLHVASGIPVKNINPVIIVHAKALVSLYKDDIYRKKYKVPNPNLALIGELINAAGAKIIACGQAMEFFEVTKKEMIDNVKVSLTAQTVLSSYQLKGYVVYKIDDLK